MIYLLLGILVWTVVHLFPALSPAARAQMVAQMGAGYRGLYSLAILLSVGLMVLGWRSMEPTYWYDPLLPAGGAMHGLMFLAFVIMSASGRPTRLKRFIRHPQLTGVKLWAVAHLLVNGDDRTTILFGGLLAWAVLEVILINKRDGAWVKPEVTVSWLREGLGLVAVLVVMALVMLAHPWFAGVSVMG